MKRKRVITPQPHVSYLKNLIKLRNEAAEFLAIVEKRLAADFPPKRIQARILEVLGNEDKARQWSETPVPALGYKTPASLMETPEGMADIEDTLGAIEHGMW